MHPVCCCCQWAPCFYLTPSQPSSTDRQQQCAACNHMNTTIRTGFIPVVVHSVGKHFLVDFMSACPYDLLVKTAGGSVRYQAWCRIPKLLRLHRVIVWYKKKVLDTCPPPPLHPPCPLSCTCPFPVYKLSVPQFHHQTMLLQH